MMVYLFQFVFGAFIYMSVASVNLGFMLMLFELDYQFEMLLIGFKDVFEFRMEQYFLNRFVDCVRHHQVIIK